MDRRGAVEGAPVADTTDGSASRRGAGMTAGGADARSRMADTSTTGTANAATSKSVGCYGNTSKRDGREQEDCSVQLELSH